MRIAAKASAVEAIAEAPPEATAEVNRLTAAIPGRYLLLALLPFGHPPLVFLLL